MIDGADHSLRDWVKSILPEIEPSFDPPGREYPEPAVNLYLLELRRPVTRRAAGQPAQSQVSLRYLVSAGAEDTFEAHRMLGNLLFAAIEHPEFEVVLDPIPAETWLALGTQPQPAFVLQTPVRHAREARAAPMVRAPLVVEQAQTASLEGVVLGPDDLPVGDAQVEIVGLSRVARTDPGGRFRFGLVPAGEEGIELRVEARGRSLTVMAPEIPDSGDQLVIRFDPPGR